MEQNEDWFVQTGLVVTVTFSRVKDEIKFCNEFVSQHSSDVAARNSMNLEFDEAAITKLVITIHFSVNEYIDGNI